MIGIRRSQDRAFYDHGSSRHYYTFSFGDYQDPDHQGFGPLTVLNEDQVGPGGGFPDHPHAEIELLTYVVQGVLEYRDDQGLALLLEAGDCQRATCGTGIVHSVYNHLPDRDLVVLQFWVTPEVAGLSPSAEHWERPDDQRRGRWALVASRSGRTGSMHIHRDVDVHTTRLSAGQELEYELRPGRHLWIQVTRGALEVSGRPVHGGDGVAVSDEPGVRLRGGGDCEVVLLDMA